MAATRRDGQELLARLAAFCELEGASAAEQVRAETARLAALNSPAFLRAEARTVFVRYAWCGQGQSCCWRVPQACVYIYA
jgi:hypothetical protein